MTIRRRVLLGLVLLLSFICLTACGKQEEEPQVTILYKYGKTEIPFGEYFIYAKTVEEDYQKNYGEGIWSLELTTDDGSKSVRDVTISDIIMDINRVKVLVEHAKDMEISLSEEEQSEVNTKAAAFYEGLTKKDIEDSEVSKELVQQVMEENLLAKHVYDELIAENEFEVSDEEARMTTFYDMVFECYDVKKDGTVEEYTEEKKSAQLERANEALSTLAKEEGVTYKDIVDKYNLEYSSSYTMSKAEIMNAYGESVAGKILELSDGEVSVVIESQYGYHIFKMIKKNDEDLTKKNKLALVEQMKKDYFNETYSHWAKKYDAHFNIDEDVNMELANRFPFGND